MGFDDLHIYDFSSAMQGYRTYGGANGSKLSVIIDNVQYMLKFPSVATHNPAIHYSSATISEYIGSHIFNLLEIDAQKTYLGIYRRDDREYQIVACEDFTNMGKYSFQDFGSLKNTIITSPSEGYGTDLIKVIKAINEQHFFNAEELNEFFWDMTIIDALIGNFDRHNGNWGFLVDNQTGKWKIAPVFDCGSSLYPQADYDARHLIMNDKGALNTRINSRPLSVFKINDSKIAYSDLLQCGLYLECDKSVLKMGKRINKKFPEILAFINSCPISQDDKDFYSFILQARKERIIDSSIHKIESINKDRRKEEFYSKYGQN